MKNPILPYKRSNPYQVRRGGGYTGWHRMKKFRRLIVHHRADEIVDVSKRITFRLACTKES